MLEILLVQVNTEILQQRLQIRDWKRTRVVDIAVLCQQGIEAIRDLLLGSSAGAGAAVCASGGSKLSGVRALIFLLVSATFLGVFITEGLAEILVWLLWASFLQEMGAEILLGVLLTLLLNEGLAHVFLWMLLAPIVAGLVVGVLLTVFLLEVWALSCKKLIS